MTSARSNGSARTLLWISAWMALSVRPAHSETSRFDSFFAPGNSGELSMALEPGHEGAPRVRQVGARGSAILRRDERTSWTVTGRGSQTEFSQKVQIPQGIVFPDSLGDVNGGLSYLYKKEERRQWGLQGSVGSASDKLFHSIHETEFQTTASWRVPSGKLNSWLFLLNYSNNRSFLNNVPIPGFAYLWLVPKRGFQAVLGFPFLAMNYHPTDAWSFRLTIAGTTNQSLEIARRLRGPLYLYAAYNRSPQQWLRANRVDYSNRLIYDEKKMQLGLRSDVGRGFSLDLSGGRTFDRRLFESRDASHAGVSRAALANGWIVGLQISSRWGNKT